MSIHYKEYNEKNTGKFCSIIFKLSNTQDFSISSFDYKKCVILKQDTIYEEMIENLKKQSIVYGIGSVYIKDKDNSLQYVRLTKGVNGKLVMEYQYIDKENVAFCNYGSPLYLPKMKVCEIDVTQQLRKIFSYVPNLF
jgi:hypothetical protein